MPATVTVYANPQAQSQDLPAPPVDRLAYRSLGSSGDGLTRLGAGLQQAGAAQQDIALDQLATINEAAVKDAHAKLISSIDSTLHDPDNGYLNSMGGNAVNGFGNAKKAIADAVTQAGSSLTNPAQQRMFQAAATATAQMALTQAEQHAGQQTKVYAFDGSVARAQAAQGMAARLYNPVPGSDNTPFSEQLRVQGVELNTQASLKGLDGDAAVEYIKAGLARTYADTINHLVTNNQVQGAKDFFKQIQDTLPIEQRDHVAQVLQAGQDKDNSLSTALAVQQQGGTLKQMEDRLNEQFTKGTITTAVHDGALQRIRADDTQRRSELAETDHAVLGDVWAMSAKRPNMTAMDLPAQTIAYIRQRGLGSQVNAILKQDDPRADREAKIEDSTAFNDFSRLATTDPAAFTRGVDNGDLVTLRQKGAISKATFQHFTNLAASINRGDLKASDQVRMVHDTVGAIQGDLNAAGLLRAKPGSDQAKKYEVFEATLRQSLVAAQDARKDGKPLSREEARQIGAGLLKDQALSGTGWFGTSVGNSHKPVYQMTPEERAKPWEIPPGDRAQIIEALKAQGKPVDEATIQRRYKFVNGVR